MIRRVLFPGARALFETNGNRCRPGSVRIKIMSPIQTAGMSKAELALNLGVSKKTLYNRLNHPETLTKREERRLYELMQAEGLEYQAGFDGVELPRLRIAR